jgi:uncharacterized protein
MHLGGQIEQVTTILIFAETQAYFSRAPLLAGQIMDDFENNPVLRCEPVLPVDQRNAMALLRQHRDKAFSFCDAVSFVLMRRLGIRRVASFDHHFKQAGGFLTLP